MLLKRIFECTPLALVLVYLSPYIFFPESAHYLIHDNLDSNIVWFKTLKEGYLFLPSETVIPHSCLGIQRGLYPSSLNFQSILFYGLPIPIAYALNQIIIHAIAFIGAYKLSIDIGVNRGLATWLALSFAVVPFWPSGGLSIAGLPLLIYSFNQTLDKRITSLWGLYIIIFPFYSSLFLSNLFVLSLWPVIMALTYQKLKSKFLLKSMLLALLIGVISVATEYRFLYEVFFNEVEFSRSSLSSNFVLNVNGLLGESFRFMFLGHYHFIPGNTWSTLMIIGAIIIAYVRRKYIPWHLVSILLLIAIISVGYHLWKFMPAEKIVSYLPDLINGFAFRYYSLLPILWLIFIVVSLKELQNQSNKMLLQSMLILHSCLLFFNQGWSDVSGDNFFENSFFYSVVSPNSSSNKSMIDYYRVRDFKKINEIAPKQDGKVACLGLIPEIAQFNGYHTVGGYYSIAPRSSTKHIESIVREELLSLNQKSLERKFFLPSIQYLDEKVKVITDLQWDWNQLKDHDVKYVFSLKPIEIDELDFLSQVSEIYVYHLN